MQDVDYDLWWGFGDWKYEGFNYQGLDSVCNEWKAGWDDMSGRIATSVSNAVDHDQTKLITERFMETACRVLLKLEKENVFKTVKKTNDFQLICIEHDEDWLAGQKRLDRVRGNNK